MAFRRRPPVERTAKGVRLNLSDEERRVIGWMLDQLRDALAGGQQSESLRRLTPPAYHMSGDAEAEAEYQRLMNEELVANRLAAINRVTDLLATSTPLDDDELMAFLQSVNAVRVVLGTVLDVSEEQPDDVGDDHPMAQEHQLYGYLGYLLQCAVEAVQAAPQ
jgi:hypothetical protein